MARLEIQRDGEVLLAFGLDDGGETLSVGADPSCDLLLQGEDMPPLAFTIGRAGIGYLLGAVAPELRVNGRAPGSRVLVDGDTIEIGELCGVFRSATRPVPDEKSGAEARRRTAGLLTRDLQTGELRITRGKLFDPAGECIAELDGNTVILGADEGCDVPLSDPHVSGRHCQIWGRAGRFWVKDLDSTNGTRVNGVRIQLGELPFGATVQLGQLELRLDRDDLPFEGSDAPTSIDTGDDGAMSFAGMVTSDARMREVFETIERIAAVDEAVLVLGESGTGKELVARALHTYSHRAKGPFVALNCGAIPEGLVESELFGHQKGAFTGATGARLGAFGEADGGTLFLDELGELPLTLQPQLLRVLETGELRRVGAEGTEQVDVRVIAATHRDLHAAVEDKSFREDLYYRFVLPLEVPALRERPDDVLLLAQKFVADLGGQAPRFEGRVPRITAEARELLLRHDWPGNVRELRGVMARALYMGGDATRIRVGDIRFRGPAETTPAVLGQRAGARSLRELERDAIVSALLAHEGNRRQTAQTLGISRSTLQRKMVEYDINEDEL